MQMRGMYKINLGEMGCENGRLMKVIRDDAQ